MAEEKEKPIAIAAAEMKEFGCPYCGYRSGCTRLSCGGSAIWRCGDEECGKDCHILFDGAVKSAISLDGFYPELQAHPRRGIPSHGRPDKKPEGEGEFFHPRGIGLDSCWCFVCGTRDRDGKGHSSLHNIAAFVQCEASGKRVKGMFSQGAWLDYRPYEPDRVQVKIGACDAHLPKLKKLYELTQDGIITAARISEAML